MANWMSPRSSGRSLASRTDPFEQLHGEFENLFNRMLGRWMTPWENEGQMRLWDFDVQDRGNEVVVRAEMPGFEPEDLDVQLNQDVLTIRAERKQESEGEQSYSRYQRTITLPQGVDADKVQANYRNGVLELHMARSPEVQGKRITVSGGTGGTTPPITSQAGSTAGQGSTTSGTAARQPSPEPTEAGRTNPNAAGPTAEKKTAARGK